MKKRVGNYKGKTLIEGGGENLLKKGQILIKDNKAIINDNGSLKEIGGSSSIKVRYFYFENREVMKYLSYFSINPYRSIINNKITTIPLVMQINANYYTISNIVFIDSSDNPYFFNLVNSDIAVKDLDELLEKEIEDFGCLKDYVTEISEEDALNLNNYELQSDNTYKYIKI